MLFFLAIHTNMGLPPAGAGRMLGAPNLMGGAWLPFAYDEEKTSGVWRLAAIRGGDAPGAGRAQAGAGPRRPWRNQRRVPCVLLAQPLAGARERPRGARALARVASAKEAARPLNLPHLSAREDSRGYDGCGDRLAAARTHRDVLPGCAKAAGFQDPETPAVLLRTSVSAIRRPALVIRQRSFAGFARGLPSCAEKTRDQWPVTAHP
jgi:hypothetical protein